MNKLEKLNKIAKQALSDLTVKRVEYEDLRFKSSADRAKGYVSGCQTALDLDYDDAAVEMVKEFENTVDLMVKHST